MFFPSGSNFSQLLIERILQVFMSVLAGPAPVEAGDPDPVELTLVPDVQPHKERRDLLDDARPLERAPQSITRIPGIISINGVIFSVMPAGASSEPGFGPHAGMTPQKHSSRS
ncbi:hypothetical protein [Methanosphaerula palustris]|uniref:hypothetical protein n=1 Tax=Methanosphaerula palustris TaxID=475088 RepID=UPI0013053CE6|nr:hypothetical protein [Methanosphaerula palustris]